MLRDFQIKVSGLPGNQRKSTSATEVIPAWLRIPRKKNVSPRTRLPSEAARAAIPLSDDYQVGTSWDPLGQPSGSINLQWALSSAFLIKPVSLINLQERQRFISSLGR